MTRRVEHGGVLGVPRRRVAVPFEVHRGESRGCRRPVDGPRRASPPRRRPPGRRRRPGRRAPGGSGAPAGPAAPSSGRCACGTRGSGGPGRRRTPRVRAARRRGRRGARSWRAGRPRAGGAGCRSARRRRPPRCGWHGSGRPPRWRRAARGGPGSDRAVAWASCAPRGGWAGGWRHGIRVVPHGRGPCADRRTDGGCTGGLARAGRLGSGWRRCRRPGRPATRRGGAPVEHGLDTEVLVVVSACVVLWALVSGALARWSISAPLAFLVLGLVVTHGPVHLIEINPHSSTILSLAEVTLALVLFTDASRVQHPPASPRPRAPGPTARHRAAPDDRVRHGGGVRRAPGHRHLGGRLGRGHRGAHRCGTRRHDHGGPAHPGPDPPAAQRRERPQRRDRHPVREPVPGRCGLHRGDPLGRIGCRRRASCSSAPASGSAWGSSAGGCSPGR